MAYNVSDIEVSKINFGEIKEFKNPIDFHRIPITYSKPLIIQIKCIATLFENSVVVKSLRSPLNFEDFHFYLIYGSNQKQKSF